MEVVTAPPDAPGRGPLRPAELAEAAVLVDATVALCLLGWLFPFGGAALVALGVVPMAAVAARNRLRAVVAAGIAGCVVSALVGGSGVATNVAGCAAVGAVVGSAIRHGWGRRRTVVAATIVLGIPGAAVAVGVLAVLASLRHLALLQVTHAWDGAARLLRRVALGGVARIGDDAVHSAVRDWQITIAVALVVATAGTTWIAYVMARPTLRRLGPAPPVPAPSDEDEAEPPAPVPVTLDGVRFRYPHADHDALVDVTMRLDRGEMVGLVGPNGSGKSTLGRVLAGWSASAGVLDRAGGAGLGRDGGTSIIFQRPETQVLGVSAADDVLWGLRRADRPDVDALLARVGLDGFARRETATLSGGELQRLALAAALARAPQLLISDEATAMVDPEGRQVLVDLLRAVADDGTTVVEITHRTEETLCADRVLHVSAGRIVAASTPPPVTGRVPAHRAFAPPILRLDDVGHVYAQRTPWAHRALRHVTLEFAEGEGALVVGRNGSGKSTLAWILAGLIQPSEGEARLNGQPVHTQIGTVAVAFQHARLQLLRETVLADVRAASGADQATAEAALDRVGLDPARFGSRRVDHLSGGQQRRVALAGLLAGRPRLLVLDEPFAGLDSAGVAELTAVLGRLRREDALTLVVVSHDTDILGGVIDREIRLEHGEVVAGAAPPSSLPPAPADRSRRRDEVQLLRLVPGTSTVHRLWAGTKLVSLAAVAVALSLRPEWPTIAVTAGLVVAAVAASRIPRGAVPRLPRWFWIGIAIGCVLNASAGGSPYVHLAGMRIGVGALTDWARAASLAVVILTAAAVVSWTTPPAAVAPALGRLGRPFRRLRLPIDEWAITVGLSFRCLPLLIDEIRTLGAVRRLRDAHRPRRRRSWRAMLTDPQELMTAALTVALRRGREFASAMEARGGLGAFSADQSRFTGRDAGVLAFVAGTVAVALLV